MALHTVAVGFVEKVCKTLVLANELFVLAKEIVVALHTVAVGFVEDVCKTLIFSNQPLDALRCVIASGAGVDNISCVKTAQ